MHSAYVDEVDDDYEGGWEIVDDDGDERTWDCGRCGTDNPWRDSICSGCGLPMEASGWSHLR